MIHKYLISVLAAVLWLYGGKVSAKEISVQSPDGKLKVNIELKDKVYYSVSSGNDLLLDNCSLTLTLGDEILGKAPRLKGMKRGKINESVKREIPLKNAVVENHCNTLRMNMAGNYAIEFRVFDKGLAYRFVTDKKGEVEVTGEDFAIHFPGDYLAHMSQPNGFKTSYEYPYTHVRTKDYKPADRMSYLPVLLETDKRYKILISEADLQDYPCMFLQSTGNNGMQSLFPKCPLEFGEDGDRSVKILKEADYIAKTSGKRNFPWRFFVISDDDRDIVANEMVYNLSSPCELEDYSWIKPGQVSWEWWHDARLYGVDFRSGYNMDSYKYYIDFASTFGIPYIIMDEGWAKSTRDPFTPNPTIDLQELIKYGKERNVKIVLWLTWLTVENHFDLFKTFADWGIAGVKIDFMDRSDQWMVNYYERVAKEAAKYKLFVDFHGSFKPAGLERRYPNVLSYEGVLGMEQGGNCKPANSIYLPFMRNAVGPMDFTPGSMLSAQPEDNRSTRANAMGSGTRAYQMALFVVFESGLQMLADNPVYYYRERPCTEFISSVPVVWDETKVLEAKIGEYVVIARRSGDKWFIGAITNNTGREIEVNLDFLPQDKRLHLTYFEDGINADRQAMDYKRKETEVTNGQKLSLKLVRNGGWAGVIESSENINSANVQLDSNKRWSQEKAHAWYNAQPWLAGCNYIPATAINQIEMWSRESFDERQIEKELSYAGETLGFNTLRVFLSSVVWKHDAEGFKQRIDKFLTICNRHNIRPFFVFFDDCWNCESAYGKQPDPVTGKHNSGWVQDPSCSLRKDTLSLYPWLKRYVQDIVKTFANDERVLMWDLYNEPGNQGHDASSLYLLRNVFDWARECKPSQPLTAGVWSDARQRNSLHAVMLECSDIITYHCYGDEERQKNYINYLRMHNRPLICTEYMARTANCCFQNIMTLFKKENIGAVNWGLVAGKTNTIYSWGKVISSGKEPELWFHDIVRPDMTPFDGNEIHHIRCMTGKEIE